MFLSECSLRKYKFSTEMSITEIPKLDKDPNVCLKNSSGAWLMKWKITQVIRNISSQFQDMKNTNISMKTISYLKR